MRSNAVPIQGNESLAQIFFERHKYKSWRDKAGISETWNEKSVVQQIDYKHGSGTCQPLTTQTSRKFIIEQGLITWELGSIVWESVRDTLYLYACTSLLQCACVGGCVSLRGVGKIFV